MKKSKAQKDVAIAMGSDSDLRIMNDAVQVLKDFGVTFEVRILSAHRTPEAMLDFAETASDKGFKVIIAGAGGAAHLPGMMASATTLPVIGVPVKLKHLNGIDSLLSIAQMPKGVPVATVAIDNASNAALLAVRILAVSDTKLTQKLTNYKKSMKKKVAKADLKVKTQWKKI